MKRLLPLLLIITLFSCKKESVNKSGSVCWVCEYNPVNGVTHAPVSVCNNGEDPKPVSVDANGNTLSYLCKKR